MTQSGAVITFETAYNNQDYLCIYLDINIYSGKGRGKIVRKAHIWKLDKNNAELISPEKFIGSRRIIKNKICEYICRTMETQINNRDVYKYLNLKNFYPDENGYNFFFPQNTVAPFNDGIVSFAVPEKILST